MLFYSLLMMNGIWTIGMGLVFIGKLKVGCTHMFINSILYLMHNIIPRRTYQTLVSFDSPRPQNPSPHERPEHEQLEAVGGDKNPFRGDKYM